MATARLLPHSMTSFVHLDADDTRQDVPGKKTLVRGGDPVTVSTDEAQRLVEQFGTEIEISGADKAVEAGNAARASRQTIEGNAAPPKAPKLPDEA